MGFGRILIPLEMDDLHAYATKEWKGEIHGRPCIPILTIYKIEFLRLTCRQNTEGCSCVLRAVQQQREGERVRSLVSRAQFSLRPVNLVKLD